MKVMFFALAVALPPIGFVAVAGNVSPVFLRSRSAHALRLDNGGQLYTRPAESVAARPSIRHPLNGDHTGLMVPTATIHLSGGDAGIGFDDLQYFPKLGKVVVPAGQTGDLDLIDPRTYKVTVIPNVASAKTSRNDHRHGTTSVAYGDGYLFVNDHGRKSVNIVDIKHKRVVGHVQLAADSDYVRSRASQRELWVTEPGKHQIEVFRASAAAPLAFRHEATIAIPKGPEALVFDSTRKRAYTNEWAGSTVAINMATFKPVARWVNGCRQSRGLVSHGKFLFVGCKEGAVTVLDVTDHGKRIAKLATGKGVDIIAYAPSARLLFVPGAKDATLTVARVEADGQLERVATYRAATGAHCVAASGNGKAFVCDPRKGAILVVVPHSR